MSKATPKPKTKTSTGKDRKVRNGHEGAVEIQVLTNRSIAVELRREGLSYPEIAQRMGVTAHTVANYINTELLELREKTELDVTMLRDVELMRCDFMLKSLWRGVKQGDVPSVMAGLKVMERRSKLLGLDAPTKTDVNLNLVTPEQAAKMSDSEIHRRVQQLMAASGSSQTDVIDVDPVPVEPEKT